MLALALGFLLCCALGWLAQGRLAGPRDLLYYHWPRPAAFGPEVYFAYRDKDSLCHYELYHDLDGSMAHAARADVLLLGSSEMQYGLRLHDLRDFHEATGIRVFNLAVGYAEGGYFPLEIIKRHGLRPKLVVAHARNFFETFPPSDFARKVMRSSRWEAAKFFWEKQGMWELALFWHRFLPRIQFAKLLGPQFLLYRSPVWGSWIILETPPGRKAVRYLDKGRGLDPQALEWAKAFKADLDARGIKLALTHVPHPETRLADVEALGRALGAPVLAPRMEGGWTEDGTHLDAPSARQFARLFFAQLAALPQMRELSESRQGQPRGAQ